MLPMEMTDKLAIHWQHPSSGIVQDTLSAKLGALELSQGPQGQVLERAFGDQLIPAKRTTAATSKSSSGMAAQTRSNPLGQDLQNVNQARAESQAHAAERSQWDAKLLLAANGQDPVQLFAYLPSSIKGPELRLVAAQEGPPGHTASAFVGESAIFRAPDGTLSVVPLVACQTDLQVSNGNPGACPHESA